MELFFLSPFLPDEVEVDTMTAVTTETETKIETGTKVIMIETGTTRTDLDHPILEAP